jgi:YbgC/YbaW family acyl-CoA thioester hydrolase
VAFTSVQKVRFDDVDGAGIVYYPQFFKLCHAAFEDFFDDAAPVSYPEMIHRRRRGFPTVHIESDFRAPLAYGDHAVVELRVEKIGSSSVAFRYVIRRKRDGETAFLAQIVCAYMDLDAQRAVPLDDDLRAMFTKLLAPP